MQLNGIKEKPILTVVHMEAGHHATYFKEAEERRIGHEVWTCLLGNGSLRCFQLQKN
jgi:hypothetical protein